jgi:hypothetical protein
MQKNSNMGANDQNIFKVSKKSKVMGHSKWPIVKTKGGKKKTRLGDATKLIKLINMNHK